MHAMRMPNGARAVVEDAKLPGHVLSASLSAGADPPAEGRSAGYRKITYRVTIVTNRMADRSL